MLCYSKNKLKKSSNFRQISLDSHDTWTERDCHFPWKLLKVLLPTNKQCTLMRNHNYCPFTWKPVHLEKVCHSIPLLQNTRWQDRPLHASNRHPFNLKKSIISIPATEWQDCPLHNNNNNNNKYSERLTRTGPKRLHVLHKYILSKFNAYIYTYVQTPSSL